MWLVGDAGTEMVFIDVWTVAPSVMVNEVVTLWDDQCDDNLGNGW
jgi:hypothetical protein